MKMKSLEQMKQFAEEKHLPLEKMRFYFGDEMLEPKCFYIYQDRYTLEWVVCKNKADGTRVERYRGNSEEQACQIIWDKLEEEAGARGYLKRKSSRKEITGSENTDFPEAGKRKGFSFPELHWGKICVIVLIAVVVIYCIYDEFEEEYSSDTVHRGGYYVENNDVYYCQNDEWYSLNDDIWYAIDIPYWAEDWEDYYYGSDYAFENSADDFENSDYYNYWYDNENADNYNSGSSYNDDDDGGWFSDWDWDSADDDWGDWDSGDSDWDSDW